MVSPVPRKSLALQIAIPAMVMASCVVFCSLALVGTPPGLLPTPSELRGKEHTLSLTLHAPFHCHLLNHEDKGMTARVPFE